MISWGDAYSQEEQLASRHRGWVKIKDGSGRTMRRGRQETRLLESTRTERWCLESRKSESDEKA